MVNVYILTFYVIFWDYSVCFTLYMQNFLSEIPFNLTKIYL